MDHEGGGQGTDTVVEALEGGRIIRTWDDLETAAPGEEVLVGLPSPLADAVWVWGTRMNDDTPVGEVARAARDIILGLYRSNYGLMINSIRELAVAFGELIQVVTAPVPPRKTRGREDDIKSRDPV